MAREEFKHRTLEEDEAEIIHLVTIKDRKWRWIRHIFRRDHSNITRQELDWIPQGK